ncbi:hypothetical protein LL912_08775 [Niabella sp. CC-SYL272]|uniref:hypothetical protein n=1 Tax=Niabella agricola TaxID=2891571 RepID=UPI001F2ABCE1|nr:hypothetical protein [Niabella agricola]MCF3108869.1 hypothetical protein [Niabella agricola]
MFITFFIISRVLLIACFVLILGYIFGSFASNKTLARLTKIAAVLLLAGFIASHIFIFRFRQGYSRFSDQQCWSHQQADSIQYKSNKAP